MIASATVTIAAMPRIVAALLLAAALETKDREVIASQIKEFAALYQAGGVRALKVLTDGGAGDGGDDGWFCAGGG